MQFMVADRLMEAKPRAINNYVFNIVTHEHNTKLMAHEDLVPMARGARVDMTDVVARPLPHPLALGSSLAGGHPESASTKDEARAQGLPTSAEIRSMYYQDMPDTDATQGRLISSLPGAGHDSSNVKAFKKSPMQALNVSGNGSTCHQRRAPASSP
jgi:hypothetical protein